MTAAPLTVVRLDQGRATAENRIYKLTPLDRDHLAILHGLNLWTNVALGREFGIDRTRVARNSRTRTIMEGAR